MDDYGIFLNHQADHRKIYEEAYGCVIPTGFDVHHMDCLYDSEGNALNNDPSNLVLMTRSQHSKWHWEHGGKERLFCTFHTPERNAKIAQSMMGNTRGVGNKSNTGRVTYNKGVPMPEETKAKLTGRKRSPEVCKRISEACAGRTLTEEHKASIAEFHRGNTYRRGQSMPESSKVLISSSLKGNTHALGRKAYTNGTEELHLLPTDSIPEGYYPGSKPRTRPK
jgi:hypothetical protein